MCELDAHPFHLRTLSIIGFVKISLVSLLHILRTRGLLF